MGSPNISVQVMRFTALALNTAVLMPCGGLTFVGAAADVGIHEQHRALVTAVTIVCAGAVSVSALLFVGKDLVYQITRWIAVAANLAVVIAGTGVLLNYHDNYPFYGALTEFGIAIGVAAFTALALWLRGPSAQELAVRLSGI